MENLYLNTKYKEEQKMSNSKNNKNNNMENSEKSEKNRIKDLSDDQLLSELFSSRKSVKRHEVANKYGISIATVIVILVIYFIIQ